MPVLAPVDAGAPSTTGIEPAKKSGIRKTVGRLTSINVIVFMAALITGPLQAHALGPRGRGELAEVLVPISIAGFVLEFGLGTYAMREAARGRSVGTLFGTLGAILVGIGCLGALASPFIASALVGQREPMHNLVILGLALFPVALLTNLAVGICAGLERWRDYSVSRIVIPVGTVLCMGLLWGINDVTVTSVAILTFALSMVAMLPALNALRGGGRLRFEKAVCTEGLRFGSQAWMGALLGSANLQIGQILLVALVGPEQLGLFVVAANVAGSADMLSSAVYNAIFPRIATGDHVLAARACRTTLAMVAAFGLVVGAAAPLAVPVLFGSKFEPAVMIVECLLVATVATAASTVLAALLTGAGKPGLIAVGDGIELVLTTIGLVVLLPLFGGIGAAIAVTVAAFGLLTFWLYWARRICKLRVADFILPRRTDLAWIQTRVRSVRQRTAFFAGRRGASATHA